MPQSLARDFRVFTMSIFSEQHPPRTPHGLHKGMHEILPFFAEVLILASVL